MLVVQLVADQLGAELRHYARALQLLDQGFAQRVEAALGLGSVLAHLGQVPVADGKRALAIDSSPAL